MQSLHAGEEGHRYSTAYMEIYLHFQQLYLLYGNIPLNGNIHLSGSMCEKRSMEVARRIIVDRVQYTDPGIWMLLLQFRHL